MFYPGLVDDPGQAGQEGAQQLGARPHTYPQQHRGHIVAVILVVKTLPLTTSRGK